MLHVSLRRAFRETNSAMPTIARLACALLSSTSAQSVFGFAPVLRAKLSTSSLQAAEGFPEKYDMPEDWLKRPTTNLASIDEYKALYKRSVENPRAFWTDIASKFEWRGKVELDRKSVV